MQLISSANEKSQDLLFVREATHHETYKKNISKLRCVYKRVVLACAGYLLIGPVFWVKGEFRVLQVCCWLLMDKSIKHQNKKMQYPPVAKKVLEF